MILGHTHTLTRIATHSLTPTLLKNKKRKQKKTLKWCENYHKNENTLPHNSLMFWFHNTHPERMQKQTNKKQPRCKKIQEQERKIVPINGMRVKRGEKRLKREKSGNIDWCYAKVEKWKWKVAKWKMINCK